MTTIVQFNPQPTTPFQFFPVLDGVTYVATVIWSLYGQRYYLSIRTVDGTLVLYTPLIGSPNAGYVDRSVVDTSTVTLVADVTSGSSQLTNVVGNIGSLIQGSIIEGNGIAFNTSYVSVGVGVINMSKQAINTYVGTTLTFTYTQKTDLWVPSDDPLASTINLTAGYFNTPIVFRQTSNNFEIG